MTLVKFRFCTAILALCALSACGGGGNSIPSRGGGGSSTPTPLPQQSLNVAPSALTFPALGSANSETFTASEEAYTGNFTETDTCNAASGAIATVTPLKGVGPSATFTVTPQHGGSCSVMIADTSQHTASVAIVVDSSPPVIVAKPAELTFTAAGSANAQTLAVSESEYSSAFTESDSCSPQSGVVATVSPANATGPNATFTVTPQNAGSCTITISDSAHHTATVPVGVTITQGGIY